MPFVYGQQIHHVTATACFAAPVPGSVPYCYWCCPICDNKDDVVCCECDLIYFSDCCPRCNHRYILASKRTPQDVPVGEYI